jgi:hypothetical protein
MSTPAQKKKPAAKDSPFGAANRRSMIQQYFLAHGKPTPADAWIKVYGLLLWIDGSVGLAHCYESDKCQPGKHWYSRALAFHAWLADSFKVDATKLKDYLDWMFRRALDAYLIQIEQLRSLHQDKGAEARESFSPISFPLPGADPELEHIIMETLAPYIKSAPPADVWERLAIRVREYWKKENKRKNLLGEGFEDVLAETIKAIHPKLRVRTRTGMAEIDGFYAPSHTKKATKVDLVIENPKWPRPILVNVKWSIRADREDQLWDDFNEYTGYEQDGRGFDHYLLTNEFDPARLNALCNRRQANSYVFLKVVHINTDGLLAAYQMRFKADLKGESSFSKVAQQIETGRLIPLTQWLKSLTPN